MPRKETFERSGNFRFASPPASWDSANAAVAAKNNNPAAATTLPRELHPNDQALLSQVRIYTPPDPSFCAHGARRPHACLHTCYRPSAETAPVFCGGKPCRLKRLPVCDGTRIVLPRFLDPARNPDFAWLDSLYKPN